MTNQQILNMLSTLEAAFYYRQDGHDDPEGIDSDKTALMHTKVNELLHIWHIFTGLTLTD